MNVMLFVISIIILIISITILFFANKIRVEKKEINNNIKEENKNLENENKRLQGLNTEFKKLRDFTEQEIVNLEEKQNKAKAELASLSELAKQQSKNQIEMLKKCVSEYADVLETRYRTCEKEFDENYNALQENYNLKMISYKNQIDDCKQELENLKSQRAAAIEAKRREQVITDNPEQYCLKVTPQERNDIQTLERVKSQLNNPRILSMLIWSTYFQKQLGTLCNQLLGVNTVCGIYKITNLETGLCYIGQSVDVSKRWKEHCKCGLGIDTPVKNKLYQAMQEYGIWSFSWELLETCSSEKLNEKEKYYIELYQAKEYGYNSQGGNK